MSTKKLIDNIGFERNDIVEFNGHRAFVMQVNRRTHVNGRKLSKPEMVLDVRLFEMIPEGIHMRGGWTIVVGSPEHKAMKMLERVGPPVECNGPNLNFDGIDQKEKPECAPFHGGSWVPCPKCACHGYHNLILHEYGPGKHFQSTCSNCNTWGWVDSDSEDAKCIHEFVSATYEEAVAAGQRPFTPCTIVKCKKCGEVKWYDTSD